MSLIVALLMMPLASMMKVALEWRERRMREGGREAGREAIRQAVRQAGRQAGRQLTAEQPPGLPGGLHSPWLSCVMSQQEWGRPHCLGHPYCAPSGTWEGGRGQRGRERNEEEDSAVCLFQSLHVWVYGCMGSDHARWQYWESHEQATTLQ